MLDEAVKAANEGHYVIVAAANMRHVEQLYARLLGYEDAEPTNPQTGKVYFRRDGRWQGEVSVVAPELEYKGSHFDWYSGMVLGMHPDVPVFADHFALEQKMGWMLDHWLRWHEPSDFRQEYPSEYKP
jgi:hypothetical protein